MRRPLFSVILKLTFAATATFSASFFSPFSTSFFPFAVSTSLAAETVAYRNPVATAATPGAWADYGFGDPFVFRFNGRYYLYPSTRDDQIGVKCWSSRDLVDWRYEGLCAVDPTTKGAYAPEIFRWNDAFYMLTSPAGRGHFIYRAPSPTGPFERISENIGLSIDGSFFIDDDGSAYFYSASDRGICAYRTTAPNEIDPKPLETGAFTNGWTEGPTVFKSDGVYYATYCGNHVFSRGYRIDAAVGDSPLKFAPIRQNPILVSTDGPLYGIGHNSVVKGPNLDVYYAVYHSLVGRGTVRGWPVRETNVDRLVLNRDAVSIVGPTRTPQTLELPDRALWFDSDADLAELVEVRAPFLFAAGQDPQANAPAPRIENGALRLGENRAVVLPGRFDGDFTAEFNLALPKRAESAAANVDADVPNRAGVLFCWRDERNFGRIEVDDDSNRVEIAFVVDGATRSQDVDLPPVFSEPVSFASTRSLQVERTGDRFSFFVDDRRIAEATSALPGGEIGYFSAGADAIFGFLGATAATEGRSANRLAVPIPGEIDVGTRTTANGRGAVETTANGERRRVSPLESGDALELEIDVAEAGLYDAAVRYAAANPSSAALEVDDEPVGEIDLPSTQSEKNDESNAAPRFSATIRRKIALPVGKSRLRLVGTSGGGLLASVELTRDANGAPLIDFPSFRDAPAYSDGDWETVAGGLISVGDAPFGKRLYGDADFGDCRIDAELTFPGPRSNGGIVFRVQNPALGGPNNSPKLGTDFFEGYFVGFASDSLILGKHSYNWTPLRKTPLKVEANRKVALRVDVFGNRIVVSVDGEPKLEYVDDEPFYSGRVGVRTCGAPLRVDNFRVEPLMSGEQPSKERILKPK